METRSSKVKTQEVQFLKIEQFKTYKKGFSPYLNRKIKSRSSNLNKGPIHIFITKLGLLH